MTPGWNKLRISVVVALAALLPLPVNLAAAESPSPGAAPTTQAKADQTQLDGVEDQAKSITQRIAAAQHTMELATAKLAETNQLVAKFTTEQQALIPDLQAKTAVYQQKRVVLNEAVSVDYKREHPDGVELLVQDGTIAQTFTKGTYMQAMQDKIDRLAGDAQKAYDDLHDRKSELDNKRSTLEVLQRQLGSLSQSITQQQTELTELAANKNNEAAYLADKIKREQAAETALLNISGSGDALWGTYADGARVKQGDVIGLEGSTGNSTGCHLHFSVIRSGQWVDPQPFLDAGTLRHPDGSQSQAYGMTDWARTGAYGGSIHNGIDFVQPCGAPTRAAADGVVIRDNRTDGSGFGHYIMIRHDNGLITLYGHLI